MGIERDEVDLARDPLDELDKPLCIIHTASTVDPKKVYNLGCDSLKKVHTENDSVCIWINGKTRLIQKEKEGLTFNLSRANDYNNSSQLHNVAGRPKYML